MSDEPLGSVDLLLHPVRLRVVQALLGGRRLTTADLAAELPEVRPATLYRHVATLLDAGVLEVVAERRVRGAVERTYSLVEPAATADPGELADLDADAHRAMFTTFVATLLADFDRYLEQGRPDLVRDGVGYRQAALWLSDTELGELGQRLAEALGPYAVQGPGSGRTRRLLTTILMPSPSSSEGLADTP